MAYEVRGFSGVATETALTALISAVDTTLSITLGTGASYPSSGSFYIVVDLGLSTEEKILCSAQSANALTVASGGRGADGTPATAHAVGASVKHVIAAVDLSEANRAVNRTVGQITAVGELLVGDALNSLNNLAPGANNTVLVADSTVTGVGLKYTTLGPSSLATDSVTTVKILDANVTTGKLADSSVTTLKLADNNVTTAKILNDNVTTAKILDGNVTTAKLAANAVTAAKITAATITATELASNAVTTAKILDDNVTTSKILDANVTYAKLAADVAQLLTPAGIIVPYAGGTAPANYLLCDGASVAVASYTALHTAIGYTYGGSGPNFNLPDLKGRVIAGKEATATRLTAGLSAITSTTLGATGGNEALHTHTHAPTVTATQASHSHGAGDYGHSHGVPITADSSGSGGANSARNGSGWNNNLSQNTSTGYASIYINSEQPAITVSAANANTGAGGSQNVQPTIILNYIIKT